jgi:hypothetical protein
MRIKKLSIKKVAFLVVPSLFLLVSGIVFGKPKKTVGREGLYVSYSQQNKSPYFYYVRLYEDGLVLTTTSTGNPKQVSKWFNRTHPDLPKGRYRIDGDNIKFSTLSKNRQSSSLPKNGIVDYKGKIKNGLLRLHSYSHDTKHKDFTEYKMISTLP